METVTKNNAERLAFETFSDLHPVEAFNLNKTRFCDYVRKRIDKNLSNSDIENIVNAIS